MCRNSMKLLSHKTVSLAGAWLEDFPNAGGDRNLTLELGIGNDVHLV